MIYMTAAEGSFRIIVLETPNLADLMKGVFLETPDKNCLIAWTPDPVWLADKLLDTNGDIEAVHKLIEEAAKRPQKGDRKAHALFVTDLQKKREGK